MAWNTTSDWNPTKDVYGTPVGGLTNKQQDMSTARNPMNNNAQNNVLPQNQTEETWAPEKTQMPQQQDQKKVADTQASVQELKSKIGTAAYSVQGLVNKFLKEGSANINLKSGLQTVFDPTTKQYITKNVNPEDVDVSGVVKEKMGQIGELKKTVEPYFYQDVTGNWKTKSMPEAVKGLTHYNSLDQANKTKVDELIGMAGMINEYDARGQGKSAEASALRQQLQTMDQSGVVSGMYKAIKDYQKFAGNGTGDDTEMKWYGDAGSTGVGISDILAMDMQDIEDEVRKAITSSSGLFGGTYESGLKRQVDTESAEAKAANAQETEYRNKLLDASNVYFNEKQTALMQNANAIKASFDKAAPAIIAEMDKDKTPAGQAARDFFTQLSAQKPESFTSLINTLLYDKSTGLQREQRQLLQKYVGAFSDTTGDEGQIGDWMDDLASQGYISALDAEGNEQKIELNAQEKYYVLLSLQNGDTAKIKELIGNVMGRAGIAKGLNDAIEMSKANKVEEAVATFGTTLAQSLKTFAGSATENAIREALNINEDNWNALSPVEKAKLMSETLKANPQVTIESAKSAADIQLNNLKETAGKNKAALAEFGTKADAQLVELQNTLNQIEARKTAIGATAQGFISNLDKTNHDVNYPKYANYFQTNKEYFSKITGKTGEALDKALSVAADVLTLRDFFYSLSVGDPEMYAAIKKAGGYMNEGPAFAETDPASAMKSAVLYGETKVKTLSKVRNDLLMDQGGILTNALKQTSRYRAPLDGLDYMTSQVNGEIQKVNAGKENATKTLKSLDEMVKAVSQRVFSPDQIGRYAQEIAHGIEKSSVDMTGADGAALDQYDSSKINKNMLADTALAATPIELQKFDPISQQAQMGAITPTSTMDTSALNAKKHDTAIQPVPKTGFEGIADSWNNIWTGIQTGNFDPAGVIPLGGIDYAQAARNAAKSDYERTHPVVQPSEYDRELAAALKASIPQGVGGITQDLSNVGKGLAEATNAAHVYGLGTPNSPDLGLAPMFTAIGNINKILGPDMIDGAGKINKPLNPTQRQAIITELTQHPDVAQIMIKIFGIQ